MNNFMTLPIAHPEWLPDAIKAMEKTIAMDREGLFPENIRGFMLATPAIRLLHQYAVGTSWTFDGRIKLRFLEANHAHPAALMIVGELGKEFARVPLEQFYQAVKWMHDGAPR